MSGWHHHGDNVTMGYVLQGEVTLEFGPDGSEQVEVNEGEYFERATSPPGLAKSF